MAQPKIKEEIEARVKDTGDTMTGRLIFKSDEKYSQLFVDSVTNYCTYLTYQTDPYIGQIMIQKDKILFSKYDGTNWDTQELLHTGNINNQLDGRYVNVSGDTMTGGLINSNREPLRFTNSGTGTYTLGVMYEGNDGITFETPRTEDSLEGAVTPFKIHTRGGQTAPLECGDITANGNLVIKNFIDFGKGQIANWGSGEIQFTIYDRNNNGQRYIHIYDKTAVNDLKNSLKFCEYINNTYYVYDILNQLNYQNYTIPINEYKDVIGYLNLLHLTDFTRYGYTNTFKSNGSTISLDTGWMYKGNACIKIDTSSSTGGIKGLSSYALEPECTYTFSCMLWSNTNFTGGTTNPVHMWVGTQPDSGSHMEIITAYNQNLIANQWVQCYVTFKTPGDNQIYYFTPFLYGLPSGAIIYATCFSLVKGSIIPNYSRITLGDAWYRGDAVANAVWN